MRLIDANKLRKDIDKMHVKGDEIIGSPAFTERISIMTIIDEQPKIIAAHRV